MGHISPEEFNRAAVSIMAAPMSEWRPGQKEAFALFQGGFGKGPVALISGRRVGKTANALRFLLFKMLTTPGLSCCFVSKTLSEAKQMAFNDQKFGVLRLVPPDMIARRDLGDAYVELINGSSLQLYGGRDPNKVRGRGFRLVIFDEPAFYKGGWDIIQNVLVAFDAPRKKTKAEKLRQLNDAAEEDRIIIFCTTPFRNETTKKDPQKVQRAYFARTHQCCFGLPR